MSKPIVLVTGGRDYHDRDHAFAALDEIGPGLLIEGGARGADRLAAEWAKARGVHALRVEALWGSYGKAAGSRRNAVMIEVCRRLGGSVVAFPGGSGTADCVRRAAAAGLDVRRVEA